MPFFQNPGCGAIPDELKDLLQRPLIHNNTIDDKINKVLEGATFEHKTNTKTDIYSKPKTYEDAVKDFMSMEPNNVKKMQKCKGFIGFFSDGRRVNVREVSKGNSKGEDQWPTLEIQNADGSRNELKVRYTKEINGNQTTNMETS